MGGSAYTPTPLRLHGVGPEALATHGNVYQLGVPPRRIDILTSIDAVSFDEAWAGRTEVVIDGLSVPFLGRATLLKNKAATGRAKDLADIALLQEAESKG